MKRSLQKAVSSLFALLLILYTLSACKKDEGQFALPTEADQTCLITRSYTLDPFKDSIIYQYSKKGSLLKSIGYYAGKEKYVLNYEYDGQERMIKLVNRELYLDKQNQFTVEVIDTTRFEYNSKGQVAKYYSIRTTQDNIHTLPPVETIYEYDNEGNRIKITKTFTGIAPYITEFTYKNGNCVKTIYNPGQTAEVVEEYEHYLDKANKLKPQFISIYFSEHTVDKNMVKKKISTNKQFDNLSYTALYSYEFNDKGFPTKTLYAFTSKTNSYTSINISEYECR